jgi:hypothetical protein
MAKALERFTSDRLVAPNWAAEPIDTYTLVPGGAKLIPTQFPGADAVVVTATANAAADATSITVSALKYLDGRDIPSTDIAIPSGSIIDLGAKKFAQLTANAMGGATTLAVEALATAIASGDTTNYLGCGPKRIESGTILGRTYTERDAGTGFGPAADSDDEVFILAFTIPNAAENDEADLVRHQTLIKENWLPGFAAASTAIKAKVRASYQTVLGV